MNKATVLVTGATGNAGQATCQLLAEAGYTVRMADVGPPAPKDRSLGEFVRCDTRTVSDVQSAVSGCAAVIHLAAWHCAHQPPVSDDTIFAVNVDGTFHLLEACRREGVGAFVFASSMAYGLSGVYGATKVLGENLCQMYHEMTGASVAMLRYHDFVPKPYLDFGAMLLRNGVDRRDVAASNLAALEAALDRRFGLFRTIVHTAHGMPPEVIVDFQTLGPAWAETQVPGARTLLEKYQIVLPERIEQHDLSEAAQKMGWTPKIGFREFLRDLTARDARGEDVRALWAPGQIPAG